MHRSKLIPSTEPTDCEFSRCGRTDKGVSALRQVISLRVRSLLTPEEQADPKNDARELDYLHILNQLLPEDIRMYEIALRPPEGFDARFSCLSRSYRYYFYGDDVDITKMREAALLFKGEHDFRNFCKVDGSKQITNFERTVMDCDIMKFDRETELYWFDLKGSAFLWHQVRSMVAILFLIGRGHEQPEIITELLDVEKTPRRPIYEMAHDIPLVLYDCEFPAMEWKSFKSTDSLRRLKDQQFNVWHDYWMKYHMITTMRSMVEESVKPPYMPDAAPEKKRVVIKLGNGKGKHLTKYTPLAQREKQDPPELINERWRKRKNKPAPGEVF